MTEATRARLQAVLTQMREEGGAWGDTMGKEQILKLVDEIAAVVAEAGGDQSAIPTNWTDPLLTGPTAVIGRPPYGLPDIERLLVALRTRAARLRQEAP